MNEDLNYWYTNFEDHVKIIFICKFSCIKMQSEALKF